MIHDIAAAFNAADPTLKIKVSKGHGLTADQVEERLQNNLFYNCLMGVDVTPDSDVHRATFGEIVEGRLMMCSFAKIDEQALIDGVREGDLGALDRLKLWWRAIAPGFGEQVLHNIKTKTILGDVTFLRWRAYGGYQDSASPYGNIWLADQLVEYTVRK